MHRYMSRRTFMILFNGVTIFYVWAKGQLELTLQSVIVFLVVMGIMNYVVLRSMRSFPDWK